MNSDTIQYQYLYQWIHKETRKEAILLSINAEDFLHIPDLILKLDVFMGYFPLSQSKHKSISGRTKFISQESWSHIRDDFLLR